MASVRSEQGFTLVEMVLTIVIISAAGVGIGTALAFNLSHQSDGLEYARTTALAQAYVEEILAKRYDETTPIGGVPPCSPGTIPCSPTGGFDDGEVRAEFDDVDDYHNLDELPPRHPDGSIRSEYQRFRVEVQVTYASPAQIAALGLADPTDAKVIAVRVTPPGATATVFNVTRTNF